MGRWRMRVQKLTLHACRKQWTFYSVGYGSMREGRLQLGTSGERRAALMWVGGGIELQAYAELSLASGLGTLEDRVARNVIKYREMRTNSGLSWLKLRSLWCT